MANLERLDQVINIIETNPERWDQGTWGSMTDCGSTYCIAGWACLLAGLTLNWFDNTLINANGHDPFDAGQKILELTDEQAHYLFFARTDLDEIKLIRKEFEEENG